MRRSASIVCATLLAFFGTAQAGELAPHRAVYDLELKEASDRSGIRSMNGRIVYEITGSKCEGFASRYRFKTLVEVGGRTFDNDQQSTSYESADGKTFTFVTRSYLNGQREQDLKGSATRDGRAIAVRITVPDEREVELETALFMNEHMVEILERAEAGETFFQATIFDGSDEGDTLTDTTTTIGTRRTVNGPLGKEKDEAANAAGEKTVWPVTVSYFGRELLEGGGERVPTYRITFLLQEDGVSRDLTMDYNDYTLSGSLTGLEYLPVDSCEKN